MKLSTIMGLILLAAAFIAATTQMARRSISKADPNFKVIRMGHWLIHAGMREGLDAVIADYEKLHPGVRIQQNTVPLKTWPAWQRAQWTGGTTPDIMQLGKSTGETELSRYYLPLSRQVEEANSYNAGSPLAGMPWNETFVDGLTSASVYFPSIGGVYGIPLQVNTTRIYYNLELLKEITGSANPPANLDEFLALGPKTRAYSKAHNRHIVPLSICGPYAELLLGQVFGGMTQTVALDNSTSHTLRGDQLGLATGWLEKRWSFADPSPRLALELWSQVASLAQPGYLQLQREDAHFTFATGDALMIFAGSWDFTGITQESAFAVGVARFPSPKPGEGRFGKYTLGPTSEAEAGMEAVFGVSRDSEYPEVAIDFLRFLSSHQMASKLSQISQRISAVVEVTPPEALKHLIPSVQGATGGLPPGFRSLSGGNASLAFSQNLHLLTTQPDGSDGVDMFIAAVGKSWPAALRRDMGQVLSNRVRTLRAADTRLFFAALNPEPQEGVESLQSAALDQEIVINQLRQKLAR